MSLKLLITGGAGFMGSNFIRYILNKYPDYKVINLDKMTYAGNQQNLVDIEAEFGDRYEFIKGDIANAGIVNEVLSQGIDAVINYAAETHVDRSLMEDPLAFLKTEIFGNRKQ